MNTIIPAICIAFFLFWFLLWYLKPCKGYLIVWVVFLACSLLSLWLPYSGSPVGDEVVKVSDTSPKAGTNVTMTNKYSFSATKIDTTDTQVDETDSILNADTSLLRHSKIERNESR